MAFNLPLPTMEDTSILGQLARLNALQKSGQEAKYAGTTAYANALSKLAYANLMGPQFMAKLMGNKDILANMNDPSGNVNKLEQTALNGGTNGQPVAPPPNAIGGLAGLLINKLGSIFDQTPNAAPGQQGRNPLARNAPVPTAPQEETEETLTDSTPSANFDDSNITNKARGVDPNSQLGKATNAWLASPEAKKQSEKDGYVSLPKEEDLIDWYDNKVEGLPAKTPKGRKSFAENVAEYQGIEEEGKEAGTIRAKDIKELNDTYETSLNKAETFNDLNTLLASPVMRELRQIPLAGRHEMAYYAKEGTKAQQEAVGKFQTLTGNIVRDASQDFKGAFRKGEQQLINNMKVNDSDTIDTAIGKAEELTYLNKFIGERARLTSKIMEKEHINKGDALEKADRQMNGTAIRRQIHDKLNPSPTDVDIKHMAEKYKISEKEVKKRLAKKGYKLEIKLKGEE